MNKKEQKNTRKKYSAQFKDQALEQVAQEGVPQVAKDLGLAESQLYSWRAQRKQCSSSLENQKRSLVGALRQPGLLQVARYRRDFSSRSDLFFYSYLESRNSCAYSCVHQKGSLPGNWGLGYQD